MIRTGVSVSSTGCKAHHPGLDRIAAVVVARVQQLGVALGLCRRHFGSRRQVGPDIRERMFCPSLEQADPVLAASQSRVGEQRREHECNNGFHGKSPPY